MLKAIVIAALVRYKPATYSRLVVSEMNTGQRLPLSQHWVKPVAVWRPFRSVRESPPGPSGVWGLWHFSSAGNSGSVGCHVAFAMGIVLPKLGLHRSSAYCQQLADIVDAARAPAKSVHAMLHRMCTKLRHQSFTVNFRASADEEVQSCSSD